MASTDLVPYDYRFARGMQWYGRDGRPLIYDPVTGNEFYGAVERMLTDPDYKIVKQETTATGYWVSTVWLGLDHNWGGGKPLIFETMVFPGDKHGELSEQDCFRYSTEEEALAGHEELVAAWGGREKNLSDRIAGWLERFWPRVKGRSRWFKFNRRSKKWAKAIEKGEDEWEAFLRINKLPDPTRPLTEEEKSWKEKQSRKPSTK